MRSNWTFKKELSLMMLVNYLFLQFTPYRTIYKYYRNMKYLFFYHQIYIISYWLQKCVKKSSAHLSAVTHLSYYETRSARSWF